MNSSPCLPALTRMAACLKHLDRLAACFLARREGGGRACHVFAADNRPATFTKTEADNTTIVECGYDYMGRRCIKKITVNGTVTLHQRYIYRGYLQIACVDLTRSGHPGLWLITWDPAQPTATCPLAIQKNGTWYTCGHDLTKNVTELYNTNGTIATACDYTPFGQVTTSGTADQPIQWSSEYNDTELGLVYYNYRHYNPKDGRWINRDPIAEQGGWNLYGFVGNRLLSYNDYIGFLAVGDKIDVLCPLKEKERGLKEKIGVIEILRYEEAMGEVRGPNGRIIIGGGINFEIVFKLDEENKSEERCCCKNKKFQWIQTVEKDNSPTRRQDAPYPDGTALPYYRADPGDPPRLFDAPIEPAVNLFPINPQGPRSVEVILKTRLVCASEKNKVYTEIQWGFSFSKVLTGKWNVKKI